MTTLHEDIKRTKATLSALKNQANNIAMQRVRIETELEQHQKIEADYTRQMNEMGYDSVHKLEEAMKEKQQLLENMVTKLENMVAGKPDVDDELFEVPDVDDDFEF